MAWMNQEKKKVIMDNMKPVLKKYGVKATFRVYHHSTLKMTIKTSPIDFISNYNEIAKEQPTRYMATDHITINSYHFEKNFSGKALECLTEINEVINRDNHDNSDIMTDYFDVGFYYDIKIGDYNTPYVVTQG